MVIYLYADNSVRITPADEDDRASLSVDPKRLVLKLSWEDRVKGLPLTVENPPA